VDRKTKLTLALTVAGCN